MVLTIHGRRVGWGSGPAYSGRRLLGARLVGAPVLRRGMFVGVGGRRRLWPTGLLDRLRRADTAGRLGRSGLVLAGLVVAVGVEDAYLWGGGRCPVRYRRLVAESGYSRSTVARLLPTVLGLLAEVGGIVYDRDVGEPYRVRVIDEDVLAGRGVGWLPWAATDASHRLYPEDWSHTDRATYAVWWGWSGWCGDVAAPVNVDGLAARAGLRPSTLQRRPHPAGLWNHRGDRLAVGRWDDPSLDAHREQVRYNDHRCSRPARSGLEGATLRWHGHTNLPEPDTAPPCVNEPPDDDQLWGGLIAYKPTYTTSAREETSGARPSGDAPRKQDSAKQPVVGRSPPPRKRTKWTPETTQLRNQGYFGVLGRTRRRLGEIGPGSTVRLACRRAGRPRSRPGSPAGTAGTQPPKPRPPFRPLLRPTPTMPPTPPRRLRRHPPQPAPRTPPRRTTRGPNPTQRPQFTDRTDISPEPGYRTQPAGSSHRRQNHGSSTTNSSKPPLARLPQPLAAQLARLATRHRIIHDAN